MQMLSKLIVAGLICSPVSILIVSAQETRGKPPAVRKPASKPVPAASGKQTPSSEASDVKSEVEIEKLLTVPRNASSAELLDVVRKLVQHKLDIKYTKDQQAHLKRVASALLEATTRLLAAKDVKDVEAGIAFTYHFDALEMQRRLGESGINEIELELAQKYSEDKRPYLAQRAKNALIVARLRTAYQLKPEEQERLLDEIIAAKQSDRPAPPPVRLAMEIGGVLEECGNFSLAAKSYEKFAKILANDEKPEMRVAAEKFHGAARRLLLPGNPIEIEGELLDGTPVDWSVYSGKVVLVDFWWSWSTPWKEELLNIKQNYAAYHDKGFEVLGVNQDAEAKSVAAFLKANEVPWRTLFSIKKSIGNEHPLALKYGVLQIPCGILVGKDGKVLALNATGEKLTELLREHLGEPVQSKGPAKSTSPDKPEHPAKGAKSENLTPQPSDK